MSETAACAWDRCPGGWLNRCHFGDARAVLRDMIAAGVKVNCIVTSPPYWGLRSYLPADHPDKAHEIGSEPTLREFLDTMVGVFDLCRQVLVDDGTMWVNMGDSYAGDRGPSPASTASRRRDNHPIPRSDTRQPGLKAKDLVGQPWRLAFALQDAGWWLRQDIIWAKPNPMPESCRDRCTKAHEYLFLLAKQGSYYFDFEAFQEPANGGAHARRIKMPDGFAAHEGGHGSFHREGRAKAGLNKPTAPKELLATTGNDGAYADGKSARLGRGAGWRKMAEPGQLVSMRNRRSVWTVQSEPYKEAHFAAFPSRLIEPCILAGCPPGGTVMDVFIGSGTTAMVAEKLGRNWIGIDLDRRNEALQRGRLSQPSLDLEAA